MTEQPLLSRLLTWLKQNPFCANTLLVSSSLLLVLGVLEALLAIFSPQTLSPTPLRERNYFCQYHPVLGWTNKPNYRGMVNVSPDASFTVTHNARGQRGRLHPYARTPLKKRVLILGDSFAWGFGVQDHEIFSHLIEDAEPSLEVINLGVSGYGTDQELLMYSEEGHKYGPDLVMLLFYDNDLQDITTSIAYGYPKPILLPGAGPLRFANIPVPADRSSAAQLFNDPTTAFGKLKKYLRHHSHSYRFLASRLGSISGLRELLVSAGIMEPPFRYGPSFPYYEIKGESEQWSIFSRLVTELGESTRKAGARLAIVHIPRKEVPAGAFLGRQDISRTALLINEENSRRLAQLFSSSGIVLIDLLPVIRLASERGIRCYSPLARDPHLNSTGHQVLAGAILDHLASSGSFSQRNVP